jgi:hypothetical protein
LFENPDNSPYDYVDGKYVFNRDKELQNYLNDVVLKTVKDISRQEIEEYFYDLKKQKNIKKKYQEKTQDIDQDIDQKIEQIEDVKL